MKLNNKGFAISSLMYLVLVLALILVSITLTTLFSRKKVLDKFKSDIYLKVEGDRVSSLTHWGFGFTRNFETFVAPASGYYKIELWGAQGGGSEGGKGAYTSGIIALNKDEVLYVYVGGKGQENSTVTNLGGYNGGGNSGNNGGANSYGGGGATDVRLVSGDWDDFNSLKSRIMVAAGGGGSVSISGNTGGYGGALIGGAASGTWENRQDVVGGAQNSGGIDNYSDTYNRNGSFGRNDNADYSTYPATDTASYHPSLWAGGSGGGYYTGAIGAGSGGSGGSSYISGYIGCNSISNAPTLLHTNSPVHYSNKIFSNPIMKAGNETIKEPNGSTAQGHSGNGFARITFITTSQTNISNFYYSYEYTGDEQTFKVPVSGYYQIESWGAQGGEGLCQGLKCSQYNSDYTDAIGGYGGYSTGIVYLTKDEILYINVGGKGADGVVTPTGCEDNCSGQNSAGGYNGGGMGTWDGYLQTKGDNEVAGGGGGASHIATVSGTLPNLSSAFDQGKVLIISGGGGGGSWKRQGGSGGGIEGGAPGQGDKATQTTGGAFGQGTNAQYIGTNNGHGGGGGGLRGGLESTASSGDIDEGGGGSGYIGNSRLLNKYMFCYGQNCTTSTATSTYTASTTCVSNNPVSNCTKSGNGYVKITYRAASDISEIERELPKIISPEPVYTYTEDFAYTGTIKSKTIPYTGYYKLEVWGAQGGSIPNGTYTSQTSEIKGGYGGYSTGIVYLTASTEIYIVVGGQGSIGKPTSKVNGGYNGGGSVPASSDTSNRTAAGGGGATHIATQTGLLSAFSASSSSLLIVAGGGGGGYQHSSSAYFGVGGSAGGFEGNDGTSNKATTGYGTGGTQSAPGYTMGNTSLKGSFGVGASVSSSSISNGSAGGGGYYGGGASSGNANTTSPYGNSAGGGGSGYIGNSLLLSSSTFTKHMVCYSCKTDTNPGTYTSSTTSTSLTAESDKPKEGDGYARITYIGTTIN